MNVIFKKINLSQKNQLRKTTFIIASFLIFEKSDSGQLRKNRCIGFHQSSTQSGEKNGVCTYIDDYLNQLEITYK